MEIGIDSFAATPRDSSISRARAMQELIERIVLADEVGLDIFGIGEHHRKEFLDSAPSMILAGAASRTKRIRLTSAVTVLSAMDPVRIFQNYATLDLISNGRAEIVAGRGSFTEAFPLFGLNLNDYDALFSENLNLLLDINKNEIINWKGRFRPELVNQAIYPRPIQKQLPIWLGVGGTPASFVRAGEMGFWRLISSITSCTHSHAAYCISYLSSTPAVYEAREVPEIRYRAFRPRVGCVAVFHKTTITLNFVRRRIFFSGVQLLIGWVEVAFLLVRSRSPVAGRRTIRFVGDRARGVGVPAPVKVCRAILVETE